MRAMSTIPLDKSDSFDPLILDMASLAVGASMQQGLRGYGVQYLSQLSQPGGLILVNQRVPLYPGSGFDGDFEGLQVEQHPLNQQFSGTVYLLIKKKPNINFYEPEWNSKQSNTFTPIALVNAATADFLGPSFIGRNGLQTSLGATLPFCFTGFKRIAIVLKWASVGTPNSYPILSFFGSSGPSVSPFIQIQRLETQNGANFTSVGLYMGEGYPRDIDNGGSPNESPIGQFTPVLSPFGLIELGADPTFTTVSGATITVYGIN